MQLAAGACMLSVPHLESTAVVLVGHVEMEVPCTCKIHGQIQSFIAIAKIPYTCKHGYARAVQLATV